MRTLVLVIISFVLTLQIEAQRKQATWQDFLSYNKATKVAVSPTKIFCCTEGGVFYYDLQDNSVNKLADVVKLSDFGVKEIRYSKVNKVLLIAYASGNIDLLYDDGKVFNLSDIKRKALTADKSINNISFSENDAYLACGFGIVVINLNKKEIADTYFIGNEGTSIAVNDVALDEQFIYAATNTGIMRALRKGVNLQDYSNWSLIEDIPHANDKFNHLVVHAGKIIANYTPNQWYEDRMYILNPNGWERYLPAIGFVFDFQTNGDYLTIASRENAYVIDKNHRIVTHTKQYKLEGKTISKINPRSSAIADDGSFWIADFSDILIKNNAENFEKIQPVGSMDNKVFHLYSSDNALWIAPGNISSFEAPRFQRLKDGEWTFFNEEKYKELSGFHNIISVCVDPADENHFFVSSWGGGLLEYKNDAFVKRYTNHNSPLKTALPTQPDEPYVRIGGLAFDSERNLWITNTAAKDNLHKLSPSGEWESFSMPKAVNKNIGQLVVTSNDDKWILVPKGNDAYVVNKSGDKRIKLEVTSYFSNGKDQITTRMNDVYSIAEDLEGAIWIGTSKGVAVYSNPSRIWTTQPFYAAQPGLDLNDGIYHPLLETETVTAIAIDGANRKWIGTKGSGVFLISETGEQEILHFTAENSPLLSNNILAIAIHQKTGEVFFGTEKGLISYQGEATGGNANYNNVYVYPNPIRESYNGPITITGLIENSDVKITDITGNLVYKTTSLGGQAIWDGRNLNGKRVKTGVYLVFCNDEKGEETHITKLLFIH